VIVQTHQVQQQHLQQLQRLPLQLRVRRQVGKFFKIYSTVVRQPIEIYDEPWNKFLIVFEYIKINIIYLKVHRKKIV